MAFFAKKSVAFLLTILLFICASHGNDHFPQVRERYRKLLSFVDASHVVSGLGKLSPDNVERNALSKSAIDASLHEPHDNTQTRMNFAGINSFENHDELHTHYMGTYHHQPIDEPSKVNPFKSWESVEKDKRRLKEWIEKKTEVEDEEFEGPEKVAEASVKKIGETIAAKLFGANGRKGFRLGWKVGKWVYKVNNKCEKIEKLLNVTCDQESVLANDVEGMSCLVLVAGATGNMACNEGVMEKEESVALAPCIYLNGAILKPSYPRGFITQNPQKDCSSK